MMRVQHRGAALFLVTVLGAAGVSAFTVTQSAAQTGGGGLTQQASQLASQITTTGQQLDAINEQVNGAQYQLQQTNALIADDEARIAAARGQVDALLAQVKKRAVSVYQSTLNGNNATILSLDPTELASSQKYTQAASDHDNTIVGQLNEAKAQLAVREKEALQAQQQAKKGLAALQAAQSALRAKEGQLSALNSQVQGQLVSLVAQAKAQQDTKNNGPPPDLTHLPPPSGSAGAAVAYAEAQLNKCYATGGTGNPCYDCSGLTMMAWAAAGVGMSHFSGAQYNEFPHVPISAVQPGDLVFFSDPSSHVGIYVGGGTVVHATNPGNNPNAVRTSSLSEFSLAARP